MQLFNEIQLEKAALNVRRVSINSTECCYTLSQCSRFSCGKALMRTMLTRATNTRPSMSKVSITGCSASYPKVHWSRKGSWVHFRLTCKPIRELELAQGGVLGYNADFTHLKSPEVFFTGCNANCYLSLHSTRKALKLTLDTHIQTYVRVK